MCGIVGYIGDYEAAPILLRGLQRLEYRGYDSAGLAILEEGGKIEVLKGPGRVEDVLKEAPNLKGKVGIGHTRWATHGEVNEANAHPHLSCDALVAIVHNGIIENHLELRKELEEKEHSFKSFTDSEVIAHLLEEGLRKGLGIEEALKETVGRLEGSFAFVALTRLRPELLMGARKDAPLLIGVGEGEAFLASDAIAFLDRSDRAIFLDNREMVLLTKEGYKVLGFDGEPRRKLVSQLAWEMMDIEKGKYAHHTLKEIHEQALVIKRALMQDEGALERFRSKLKESKRIIAVGCGSSYHATLLFKYYLAKHAHLQVEALLASEFLDFLELIDENTTIVAISQSGETADVLKACRMAKEKGATLLSIVNVVSSSLARESDAYLSINCGPEIGVAATKSFTSTLLLLLRLTEKLAGVELLAQGSVEALVKEALQNEPTCEGLAELLAEANDVYFIGRGPHHPIALEGALKLKELSYLHAEGFPAGEIKHGSLALVEEKVPVVVINPTDHTYSLTLATANELKARGAIIIGVSDASNELYDYHLKLPKVNGPMSTVLEVIPLQLLAYHTALKRHCNPDYPRNLAKSVTVT